MKENKPKRWFSSLLLAVGSCAGAGAVLTNNKIMTANAASFSSVAGNKYIAPGSTTDK